MDGGELSSFAEADPPRRAHPDSRSTPVAHDHQLDRFVIISRPDSDNHSSMDVALTELGWTVRAQDELTSGFLLLFDPLASLETDHATGAVPAFGAQLSGLS